MISALKSPWFYGRIFVGLVFAYAGFTKLSAPIENFRGVLTHYEIIPYAFVPWIAAILPWIEITAGSFMILGYAPRLSAVVLAGLCAGFLLVLGTSDELIKGAQDCGCFGEGSLIRLSARQVFALDIFNFLLALKLYSIKNHPLSLDGRLSRKAG